MREVSETGDDNICILFSWCRCFSLPIMKQEAAAVQLSWDIFMCKIIRFPSLVENVDYTL